MKKKIMGLLLIMFIATLINSTALEPKEQITQSNNKFCIDLFKVIDKDGENNVFSSFSISNALAMAAETTNEEISNSIRRGLRLPPDITIIRDGYQSLLNSYKIKNKYFQLNIANALWVENDYSINSEGQENVEKYYLGETLAFDNSQSKDTADRVNQWCNTKTNGRIKKILQEEEISPLTQLILTNAIYFKGRWQEEFKAINSKEKIFYNSKNEQSQVEFMKLTRELAYTEDEDVQVLKMRYKGFQLSMLIILPKKNDIGALKSSLTSDMLAEWNRELKTYKVEVSLPKFKFEYEADMNEPLIQLGIERAFNPMSANEIYISKVKHKAIINVNEEGAEAAAVTEAEVSEMSAPPINYEQRIFNANHPFLFVIQDNRTQNILFMGKVEEPVYGD